jgi:hypothetical protein
VPGEDLGRGGQDSLPARMTLAPMPFLNAHLVRPKGPPQ